MTKKLSVVAVFCIGLMGLWASGAYALRLTGSSILQCPYPKHYVNGVCQSPIGIDLSWGGIGNTYQTLTDFTVVLTANTSDPDYPTRVLFRNPANNTGGTPSDNFDDGTLSSIIGGTAINPFITGKGKANTLTVFGDCDQCEAEDPPGTYVYNLPDDGKLWFLFDTGNACGSQDLDETSTRQESLDAIECIKENLVINYAPNPQWWPYAVEIDSIDVNLNAYRDGVLAVTAEFLSCQLNDQHEYVCTTTNINNNPK